MEEVGEGDGGDDILDVICPVKTETNITTDRKKSRKTYQSKQLIRNTPCCCSTI